MLESGGCIVVNSSHPLFFERKKRSMHAYLVPIGYRFLNKNYKLQIF